MRSAFLPLFIALAVGSAAQYGSPQFLANLADTRVNESSGLAASWVSPGIYWTHNDSGDGANVFATDRQGSALAAFTVAGATAFDWEDIACGVTAGGRAALYIGDIGDNLLIRNDLAIYRVLEPVVILGLPGQSGTTAPAEKFPISYPDGRHNAESLLVHPTTGEIFVVTKASDGTSGVYQYPMPLTVNVNKVLVRVGTVTFTGASSADRRSTGGDFSPNGLKVCIRTLPKVYEWPILPGQSLASALSGASTSFSLPFVQGEAITYRLDAAALLYTSEGSPCPVGMLPPLVPSGTVYPDRYSVLLGIGNAAPCVRLYFGDDAKVSALSDEFDPTPQFEVEGTALAESASTFSITIESSCSRIDMAEVVELWHWPSGGYEAGERWVRQATIADSSATHTASLPPSIYIRSGTRMVRARISFVPATDNSAVDGWSARLDRLTWSAPP